MASVAAASLLPLVQPLQLSSCKTAAVGRENTPVTGPVPSTTHRRYRRRRGGVRRARAWLGICSDVIDVSSQGRSPGRAEPLSAGRGPGIWSRFAPRRRPTTPPPPGGRRGISESPIGMCKTHQLMTAGRGNSGGGRQRTRYETDACPVVVGPVRR
jgi:hypothetical protein